MAGNLKIYVEIFLLVYMYIVVFNCENKGKVVRPICALGHVGYNSAFHVKKPLVFFKWDGRKV